MTRKILCALFTLSVLLAEAQYITHGPVIGALTSTTARFYIRCSSQSAFSILLSTDSLFQFNILKFSNETSTQLDNSIITPLNNLTPSTRYFYKVEFDGKADERKGSFKTFPSVGERGHYVFTSGSCQESKNMKTFDRMSEINPDLFIHVGDFTYPSYQMNDDYPSKYTAIQESYRRRYEEIRMKDMLWHVPIDYVYDDDDCWGSARTKAVSRCSYGIDSITKKVINYISFEHFADSVRYNCIRGYVEYFPGYNMVDTSEGLYHSFVMGNCEFIFMDTRSTADCEGDQFTYDSLSKKWFFTPNPNLHLVSAKQMQWAKDRLLNSKADWKFLVCGLPFNKSLKHLIDLGVKMQDIIVAGGGEKGTGFRLAVSWASYWAGFPNDQKELLDFIHQNKIKDVLVVSGDTHHNELDNGQNAGLPEMNVSGLAVAGTHLGYYMNLISKLCGYPDIKKYLWNHGGGGIHNKNFKNQFGKIEVNGNDNVRMSIIDEDGKQLASMKIMHSSKGGTNVFKEKPYQKRMNKRFGKKPTGWQRFVKSVANSIFK